VSEVVVVSPHPRRKLALLIAIAADVLQIVLFPLFVAIVPVPAMIDDAIDVVVAIIMIRLLGWHWAFLPSFVAELIPGVGLLPTWTAAVWFVTRKGKKAPPPAEPSVAKLP
jgi:hypothetical protein